MSKIFYFIYLINYIYVEINPSSCKGYIGGVNRQWCFFYVWCFSMVGGVFFTGSGVFLQVVGFFYGCSGCCQPPCPIKS